MNKKEFFFKFTHETCPKNIVYEKHYKLIKKYYKFLNIFSRIFIIRDFF